MPRSRTPRQNTDSRRKREQLFAPELEEWQRPSPNRARPSETNSGQLKTRLGRRTGSMVNREITGQELNSIGKSSSQRPRKRRNRSTSNPRAKNLQPKSDKPLVSGRARKTASNSSLWGAHSLRCFSVTSFKIWFLGKYKFNPQADIDRIVSNIPKDATREEMIRANLEINAIQSEVDHRLVP